MKYSIILITKSFKVLFLKGLQNKFENIEYMHVQLVQV